MNDPDDPRLFCMYVIFDNPTDRPGKIVVRRFVIKANEVIPTLDVSEHTSLEAARGSLPFGLVCIDRNPEDEKQIVESWV